MLGLAHAHIGPYHIYIHVAKQSNVTLKLRILCIVEQVDAVNFMLNRIGSIEREPRLKHV